MRDTGGGGGGAGGVGRLGMGELFRDDRPDELKVICEGRENISAHVIPEEIQREGRRERTVLGLVCINVCEFEVGLIEN